MHVGIQDIQGLLIHPIAEGRWLLICWGLISESKNEGCSKSNLVSNEYKHDMIRGLAKHHKLSEMAHLPPNILESLDIGGFEWPWYEHES